MKVILHHPRREMQVEGKRRVADLLRYLNLNPEAVLVIRGDQLLTKDMEVGEEDVVEVRPVVSGGERERRRAP
ncbi:MAG: MoaD/ThiS family protein [Armatimonadetes bacterium]|nr:MoaD/ThiS family protein [Armatimonadota bacterium]